MPLPVGLQWRRVVLSCQVGLQCLIVSFILLCTCWLRSFKVQQIRCFDSKMGMRAVSTQCKLLYGWNYRSPFSGLFPLSTQRKTTRPNGGFKGPQMQWCMFLSYEYTLCTRNTLSLLWRPCYSRGYVASNPLCGPDVAGVMYSAFG